MIGRNGSPALTFDKSISAMRGTKQEFELKNRITWSSDLQQVDMCSRAVLCDYVIPTVGLAGEDILRLTYNIRHVSGDRDTTLMTLAILGLLMPYPSCWSLYVRSLQWYLCSRGETCAMNGKIFHIVFACFFACFCHGHAVRCWLSILYNNVRRRETQLFGLLG